MGINKLKDLRILVVEDEEELLTLLEDAIGEYFYSFSTALNGLEGLEKVEKIQPDIVITDINMPHMDGIEMATKLREKYPDLPIIILSAFSDKDYLLSAIDVQVIKYFIKPFDPEELLEYLESIAETFASKDIYLAEEFIYNKNTKSLFKADKFIKITKREAKFVEALIDVSPNILSDEIIKEKLWNLEEVSDERLRTFIKRLRLKTSKTFVSNIKGQGYQIAI